MGADGGTIPKRCELIRNKKKKEKIDKNVTAATKWRTCQLSQQPLKKPIVACKLGRLYNKEAIVEGKLNKTLSSNEITKHIKSIADVKDLRLTDNKSFKNDGPDNGDTYMDFNETPFVCPVTSIGMNGTNVFTVNWNCGCVVSEKAIKEAKSETCHGCGGPFIADQLIQLYPGEELFKLYQQRVATERSLKKTKKIEANKTNDAILAIENGGASTSESTTSAATKIVQKTKIVKVTQKRKAPTDSYDTIQDDPKVSKALKSIFTSSEEAKRQPQGHWVTHNPLYF